MWKQLTNPALLLAVILLLAGCATTGSNSNEPAAAAKPLPVSARAVYGRAIEAAKAGHDKQAMQMFARMTQEHPEVALGYLNLGLLQLKSGKAEMALHSLQQAVKRDPGSAVAFNHLGVAYRELGKFEESRKAYEQALRLKPDYADAHLNLGILYDIYYQELGQALRQYEQYQALTGKQDKQVGKWVIDLRRRVKQTASRGSIGE